MAGACASTFRTCGAPGSARATVRLDEPPHHLVPGGHDDERIVPGDSCQDSACESRRVHGPQPLEVRALTFLGGGEQDLAVPAALQERRPNDSRTDHAHPDASRRSLDPQRIRECDDGVFRGTVARHQRCRYKARTDAVLTMWPNPCASITR